MKSELSLPFQDTGSANAGGRGGSASRGRRDQAVQAAAQPAELPYDERVTAFELLQAAEQGRARGDRAGQFILCAGRVGTKNISLPLRDSVWIKDITRRMALRPLKSFLPTADDVVNSDLPTLGRILLVHLKSYEGFNTVYQHVGGINREYFFAMVEHRNIGLGPLPGNEPEYGDRQPEVTRAMREAWNWLERQGHLMHMAGQPSLDWFSLSRSGEELLSLSAQMDEADKLLSEAPQARRNSAWWGRAKTLIERWNPAKSAEAKAAEELFLSNFESVGKGASERRRGENQMMSLLSQAKSDLLSGGVRPISSPSEASRNFTLIADSRLAELRALSSPQFDFTKLIRLCEELNIASRQDCHFATAMLTRGLLDHVPPVFDKVSFSEVASNYGGRSFKETMQPLDGVARKVADWHLHGQIRKSETLPTAQQVRFAASLDMLLSEIVRVTREKGTTP